GTSRICAWVARDSMSETMPGPRSVLTASSKRRWMFSRSSGRLLAKFDHLPCKVAEGTSRVGAGRVLGNRLAGQWRLSELHRVLDHGVEDPLVAQLPQVLEHLARENGAAIEEGGQQAGDLEIVVQLEFDGVDHLDQRRQALDG